MRPAAWVLVGVGMLGTGPVAAQLLPPASDDVKIQVTQQEMDEDAAGRNPTSHAEAMARQFDVEKDVVEQLRQAKVGWGEIGIRLAFAQELTKRDAKGFPSVGVALSKVSDRRGNRIRWGTMANEFGIDLGHVVTQAQHVRQQMRAEAKQEATAGVVKPGGPPPDRTSKGDGAPKLGGVSK
ncbi:MAG: hypothetical protein P0111_13150 [Nitrospira sp.]|nr:hypothetical protein [Nitrospira sp.]